MEQDRLSFTQANRIPVRLRSSTPDDLQAMYLLDQLCFRKGIAYSLAELAILVRHRSSTTQIVETAEKFLAGFCIAERSWRGGVKAGHIVTLDVHPAHRRQGVGRVLMQAQETELVSHGVLRCALEVAIDDPGAQEFYASLGYRTTARLRDYYMDQLDALMMEKELRSTGV